MAAKKPDEKPNKKPPMKMPELLVFARMFIIGFVAAEIWRLSWYLGSNFDKQIAAVALCQKVIGAVVILGVCIIYIIERKALVVAKRIARSYRIDLLAAMLVGGWINVLVAPALEPVHAPFKTADPYWAPAILILACTVMLSPIVQRYWSGPKKPDPKLFFLSDEEIGDEKDNQLRIKEQVESFAKTVLASGAHPGLIFGVDGPWGVGKTSFINLTERYWKKASDEVIVCRFEPLRYASEPDLAVRLIRDVTTAIQSQVFAPEFKPAASRYSRLIKGKADFSFLGFKLSVEPSDETVDELLDDIDEVLRRIKRRVIIVIDDLDRLDAKSLNNVLFATRQTFKLSQATYVLCYDTEVLAGGKEEGSRAREFLEKFVTVKLSLFVDSSSIRDYLRRDWKSDVNQLGSVLPDAMVKLGAILNELAGLLEGDLAPYYMPLVGDLRKVKRFVNTLLVIQIEKTDLGKTDFNKRDLINLVLLYLHYPGLFRRIYAEETEKRSGSFSVREGSKFFRNTEAFTDIKIEVQTCARFLLDQLFDVDTLRIGEKGNLPITDIEYEVLRSRACFNSWNNRILEDYLKLIVRFVTPDQKATLVFYQRAVDRVIGEESIASVLNSPDFDLKHGEHAHSEFWRVLASKSYRLKGQKADDAIETLIKYLPYYSSFATYGKGLRERLIYSLLRLLNDSRWTLKSALDDRIMEIALWLFGENVYRGNGLLERLVSPDQGVLGWNDLMQLRLLCSTDPNRQLDNIRKALILHQDMKADPDLDNNQLAPMVMRELSQKIFALFKKTYIDTGHNFFAEVNAVPVKEFLGMPFVEINEEVRRESLPVELDLEISLGVERARTEVKSFVIDQLSNSRPPNSSGAGCGYYDEKGDQDKRSIARAMNIYVIGTCFKPGIDENLFLFIDHCIAHLVVAIGGIEEADWLANWAELFGGLDPQLMGRYWCQNRELILKLKLKTSGRPVITSKGYASYYSYFNEVKVDLDKLVHELDAADAKPKALTFTHK